MDSRSPVRLPSAAGTEDTKVFVEVFQPWSNMIVRLKIPDTITKSMIEMTDEIMDDKNAESAGKKLAGQIDSELVISFLDTDVLDKKNSDFILSCVQRYVTDSLNQAYGWDKAQANIVKKDDIFTKFESMWVVSQKDNEYNPLHLHGTGCVSGVLYLKIPEYLPDRKKKTSKTRSRTTDGALEFVNNACLDGRFASGICSFNPEPGELYLFTGYQPHQVYPFRSVDGKGERRSVSFNADYITKEKLEEMRKKEASGKNE